MWGMTFWSLAVSVYAILVLWLMGNKTKWAPVAGVIGQIVWYAYAINDKQYGLLPGITVFTIIHIRNTFKWWKEK